MAWRIGIGLAGCTAMLVACAKPAPIDYGESANGDSGSGESGAGEGAGAGVCGDGVIDEGETCDDGNDDDLDACHDDCTLPGRTLWRTEFEGKLLTDIAAAADRVYVSGGPGGGENNDWLGAVDLHGGIIEYEPYDGRLITGLFMVDDARLLWGRTLGVERTNKRAASPDLTT